MILLVVYRDKMLKKNWPMMNFWPSTEEQRLVSTRQSAWVDKRKRQSRREQTFVLGFLMVVHMHSYMKYINGNIIIAIRPTLQEKINPLKRSVSKTIYISLSEFFIHYLQPASDYVDSGK